MQQSITSFFAGKSRAANSKQPLITPVESKALSENGAAEEKTTCIGAAETTKDATTKRSRKRVISSSDSDTRSPKKTRSISREQDAKEHKLDGDSVNGDVPRVEAGGDAKKRKAPGGKRIAEPKRTNKSAEDKPRAEAKKTKQDPAIVADAPSGSGEKSTKKKGRPKKSPKAEIDDKAEPARETDDQAQSKTPEIDKKKRGRPRKDKSDDTTPKKEIEEDSPDERTSSKSSGQKSPSSSEKSSGKSSSARESQSTKSSPATPKRSPSAKTSPAEEETKPAAKWTLFSQSGSKDAKDALKYDPTPKIYSPIEGACWKKDEPVPYFALARTLEEIENIKGRLEITRMLCNLLQSIMELSPEELTPCVHLCLNMLGPRHEGLELGLAEGTILKAIAQSSGSTEKRVRELLKKEGDLGLVAEASKSAQKLMMKPVPLTLQKVYAKFQEIAKISGSASMNHKLEKAKGMLVSCRGCEARYLVRSLQGKLRVGLAEQTVLTALANALTLRETHGKKLKGSALKERMDADALIVKTAYCECPIYEKLIGTALKDGVKALPEACTVTPGIPLKPMLAHPTKGLDEILRRFGDAEFSCEYKYDGERAQIHYSKKQEEDSVWIYSRNQEDNTGKYPDLVERIPRVKAPDVESFIMDTEVVAWDRENGAILPFQILTTRKRKDVDADTIKVQVMIFAFDLLYLNGESLVKKPFRERRQILRQRFMPLEGSFLFASSILTSDDGEIQSFLDDALKGNCEGLMVKTLDEHATYEIAKRSHNWLKLKKDYLEGVGDSLDLVVIGAYHGAGKRAGVYGGFLLACYDAGTENFQAICKIGTGFTEDVLKSLTNELQEHIITKPKAYYQFDQAAEPEVWFDAKLVWEVKAADLSISPRYYAALGIVDPNKGISLRFPRYIRSREDKSPEDATSSGQVASMYRNQDQIKNAKKAQNNGESEDEFY